MKSLRNHTLLLISTLLLGLTACKGPQGEPGPKGDIGATGQTGATGATGAAGTANVIQVTWAKASERPAQPEYLYYNLPQGVSIRDALVLVYVTVNGGWWLPLPYDLDQLPLPEQRGTYYHFFSNSGANQIVLTAKKLNSTIRVSSAFDCGMKAIIIPAAVLKNGRKAAIDYSNYEEVKKAYNLPD